jgi:predicted nucleic acid-binding protein/antitoxin component of MazEF toxin-antitoxin module
MPGYPYWRLSQVTVGRWGKNLAIRFPSEVAKKAGLSDGERVEIEARDGDIVIRRPSARRRKAALAAAEEIIAEGRRHPLDSEGDPCPDRRGPPRVSLVIDASLTVAWLFADERADAPQAILRRVAAEGALVPSLWRLEVANVLRNAVRQKRSDLGYATRCLERLGRLEIVVDPETDSHAWGRTRQLSAEHDLTVYDAAYLELAIRRRRPLASRDGALIKAGRSVGLDVLGD